MFRIAGDRLMAGRRILFAAGGRADCEGPANGDARAESAVCGSRLICRTWSLRRIWREG